MFERTVARMRSIDLNVIFFEAVKETSYELSALIRTQILSGKDKNGLPIGTYSGSEASLNYVEYKLSAGLFPINSLPHYNLYYSGDFLNSILVKVNLFGDIDIVPMDSKLSDIEENTGSLNEALELNEENLNEYRRLIAPLIQKKIRNKLLN